jgi:YYY domain-containing protein
VGKTYERPLPSLSRMEYLLVVVWLVTYLALGLAALPAAAALFPRFADRGAAFALPLALAVLGVVGYIVGQVAFGWPALIVGLLALVGASYLAGDVEIDRDGAAEAAVVFSAGFFLLIAVRAFDPAVHPIGGEKFLDFGLLQSLLRTGAAMQPLPPEDMWFAGEPVQYYYGGHMLSALLTTLTGTAARFAYNLALAGFFGALVVAAYGLAGNVAAVYGAPRRFAGALGAFFVGIAANLQTAAITALWLLPEGLARGLVGVLGLQSELVEWTPADFSYWSASRVIDGTINEFPLFAWLNGDLHAHMMSTPFTLLLAALLFAYWRTPETELTRRRLLVFGTLPPLAGFIAVVNTWSFPTAAGLTFLALTFAPARPTTLLPADLRRRLPDLARADGGTVTEPGAGTGESGGTPDTALGDRLREEALRSGIALGLAAAMLAVGALWALPFWLGTASGRSVGFLPGRSPLGGLLLVHGAFVLAFGAYLARRVGRDLRDVEQPALTALVSTLFSLAALSAPLYVVGLPAGAGLPISFVVLGVGLLVATRFDPFADLSRLVLFAPYLVLFAYAMGFAALALFGPLLVAAWVLLRARRDVGFETVLVVAGLGLALLVEFVYVVEQAGPERFNTVFKTYAQVWALWAPAAAVALTRLVDAGRSSFDAPNAASWRTVGRGLAVGLVFLTALYAGFALPGHFAAGGPQSLDGTAFVAESHPEEARAIGYIDGLEGQPNIVTAAPAGYRWNPSAGKGAAAPSSLTGVPTVAGWFHEVGYRGDEPYNERVEDVETIYAGNPNQQLALLDRYNVEYIYYGPAERNRYTGDTLSILIRHPAIEVVHQSGGENGVSILKVDQSKLDEEI